MNKKAMKSNVWYLLPRQALKDKNLTTNDRNVLSVLIYLSQAFTDGNGKFFRQRTKLLEDIKDSEFELSDRQITRCLVKLQHFGYIKYRAGFHNNMSGKKGCASEFELCYNTDNQKEHQNNVTPNTNTNTNSNTNVNSNSSTLYISTLRDEKVESETDNNFKQDLNMEEKLNETKWNEKKFQEMNVRKNKIMGSIEKFITASPSLSDEEIKKYIELYTNKLKEVYYRQDYAENAINIMVGRVAKARTPKTTPTETKQNCDQKVQINKPLDWMLTNLPKPTVDNIVQTIALYCQYVCDYLTKEYNNPEYRHKVESHKYWYLDNLFTYYAPVLQEYAKTVKNRDLSLNEAEGCICQIWMKHCKDFPIA